MAPKKIIVYAHHSFEDSQPRMVELEMLGFEVLFCSNASQVLRQFEQSTENRPDMLIADNLLDHGKELASDETDKGINTGKALYERLRLSYRELPIVIFTIRGCFANELRSIVDSKLMVINEFDTDGNSTAQILSAAKNLLS